VSDLVITPKRSLRPDLGELWAYRELLYFFAWRDIKVRYKQTLIGASWAVVQPLVTMVVFTIFFNRIAGIGTEDDVPYAIFSFCGLLFWNLFSQGTLRASESLIANHSVITKVYFPRVMAPVSANAAPVVDFALGSVVLVGLMIFYGIAPGWSGVLLFVPLILMTLVTSCGVGLYTSALNVKYRDVRHALPFVIQTLLFLTPVIYPVGLVPDRYQWLLYLNPLTGVISVARGTLLDQGTVEPQLVLISVGVAIALFVFGFVFFKRSEPEFADII